MSSLHRHPARAALRALAAAGLATGLALSAAPAEARTAYHADRTHDVRRASALVAHPDVRPAPRRRDGDIRSIRLVNTSYVGVKVRFADLVHRTHGYRYDLLRIVTNEHVVRNVSVGYGPGFGSGYVRVTRANRHRVHCRVTHSTDYRHNVVALHVSRSCLSRPRWVRIGYAAQTITPDLEQLFSDDALRVGTHTTRGPSTMSRKVWRH